MGKMKDLSTILDSMVECGNSLVTSATALKDLCDNIQQCGNTLQSTATALKDYYSSASTDEPTAALSDKQETEPSEEPVKTYTLEEVRAILSAKSKAGFREQVKEMITKRGVGNLTKLDPAEYPSLVKEVEGLTNG